MPLASAPCDAARFRVERLFRDSDDKLRDALEALGYYRYEVQKSLDFMRSFITNLSSEETTFLPLELDPQRKLAGDSDSVYEAIA